VSIKPGAISIPSIYNLLSITRERLFTNLSNNTVLYENISLPLTLELVTTTPFLITILMQIATHYSILRE
jgi:hypothetical protein